MIIFRVLVAPIPGKLREARAAAAALRAEAAKDPGVIILDFFQEAASERLVVIEVYRDSQALLDYIAAGQFGDFRARVEVQSIEVYGDLTAEARATVAQFGPVTFHEPLSTPAAAAPGDR
jgi:quinol monooxygenase YgiN